MVLTFMHYAHPFDRENINEPIRIGVMVLDTIACIAVGFMMGVKWYEHAFSATVDKIVFGK